jgi:hypothetical protein
MKSSRLPKLRPFVQIVGYRQGTAPNEEDLGLAYFILQLSNGEMGNRPQLSIPVEICCDGPVSLERPIERKEDVTTAPLSNYMTGSMGVRTDEISVETRTNLQ